MVFWPQPNDDNINSRQFWLPQEDRQRLSASALQFLLPVLPQPSGYSTGNSSRQTGLKASYQMPRKNQKETNKRNVRNTLRYHLTPVRMAIIKKIWRQQMLERMWRNRNTFTLLVGV